METKEYKQRRVKNGVGLMFHGHERDHTSGTGVIDYQANMIVYPNYNMYNDKLCLKLLTEGDRTT